MQTAIVDSAYIKTPYAPDATFEAGRRILDEQELRLLIERDIRINGSGGCIGNGLPRELVPGAAPESEFAALEAIDALASGLRLFEFKLYRQAGFEVEFRPEPVDIVLAGVEAVLSYAGAGNFGSAFRIECAGENFVLKVFYHCGAELLFSGPYSEAALGAFVTAKKVRDMPAMFAANPAEGWLLTEYVDENWTPRNPHGPSWRDYSLQSMDPNGGPQNEMALKSGGSCRVDYGHLKSPERRKPERSPAVDSAFEVFEGDGRPFVSADHYCAVIDRYPETRFALMKHLGCIAPEKRFDVIARGLSYDEAKYFPTQDYFEAKSLRKEDVMLLFGLLLRHSDPTVRARAVFNLSWMSEHDALLVERIWSECPEFEPFRIYRNGGTGFGAFLANLWSSIIA